MDKIKIQALSVEAIIGIHPHERQTKQRLLIDIELAVDVKKAAANDAIKDAVDYDAVAKRVTTFVADSDYQLIETLAENTAQLILSEFGIQWLRLQISKPQAVANATAASVCIERGATT